MPSVSWDSIRTKLDEIMETNSRIRADMNATVERDWDLITMGARADAGNEFNAGPFAASSYNWGLGSLDKVESTHCRYCGMILARCGCGYGAS